MRNLCNIPNFLTVFRLVFSPVVCKLILDRKYILALFVFLFASLTDFLDGFVARKMKKITNFGKILDPICDKVLVYSVMSCFLWSRLMSVWAFVVLLSRDFIISTIRVILAKQGTVCSANFFGKIKTFFQNLYIISIFVFEYLYNLYDKLGSSSFTFFRALFANCSFIFLWSAVLFSVISLIICICENKDLLSKEF